MKHSKKLLTSVLVLLSLFVLVSCKKDQVNDPYITGVEDVQVEVATGKDVLGNVFEPLAGVKATDPKDGDLTASIDFVDGGYNKDAVGNYVMTYAVTNKKGAKAQVKRNVEVVPARTFANGDYNYKFASPELRNVFFGAAESYLLDNVYGGVPLFVNSGMSIYSSRVQLPVENYVPVMGWGSMYGTLTKDDAGLDFVGGGKGVAGQRTYRGTFSSNPTTFNQWLSDDSVSSDAASFMLDSLYDFRYNEAKTAYEVVPSMASEQPIALDPKTEGAHTVSKTWRIPIREGLNFTFHPDTAAKYKTDSAITAQSFVDTFKYAIDQKWFRAIAGGSHFWATSSPVSGAKAYSDGKDTSQEAWDEVGLKVSSDGKAIEYTFDTELSQWNVQYWLSSNTFSPIHLGMAEDLGTNYGTSPTTTAYTGPYYLSNFEADKVLEYKKTDVHHAEGVFNYTGYNFAIIERAELVFEEFKAGRLDASGIPLTEYDNYKDNPGVKRSPGTTTFRMNINALGTQANQDAEFPNSNWNPVPILSNKEFRQALYFGVDRKTLAWDVLKTSDPGFYLFSNAYLVDADTGLSFRDTDEGKEVGKDLGTEGETGNYAFNPDRAKSLFLSAVEQAIGSGQVKRGTKKNPTKIELEVAVQAGSTAQAQLGAFIKSSYENLFKDAVNHVAVSVTVLPVEFPGIYYDKQLVGKFDLGMGGISGSSLDAASFLEVFSSDNRGGFTLNWGFDTSLPNIPVTYEHPTEGEVTEYWSFDGIVSVLNGSITMKDGREDFAGKINDLIAKINALPAVDALTIDDLDAVNEAIALYLDLTPGAQKQVTNREKLFDASDAMDLLVDTDKAEKLDAKIAALPANADLETVQELVDELGNIEDRDLVKKLDDLVTAYTAALNAAIAELPVVTEANLEDVTATVETLDDAVATLNALVGKDDDGKQNPNGITAANVEKLATTKDAIEELTPAEAAE